MTNESNKDADSLCKEFWTQFKQYLETTNSEVRIAGKLSYYDQVFFDIDERGQILSKVLMGKTVKKGVYVELLLEEHDQETNECIYTNLDEDREIIDAKLDSSLGWKKLGLSLKWDIGLDTIRSKISVHNKNFNPREKSDWENQYKWIIETVEAFEGVFIHRLENMNISK